MPINWKDLRNLTAYQIGNLNTGELGDIIFLLIRQIERLNRLNSKN